MTAKLGPAVDRALPTFHCVHGLFFQRQPNGDVRVMTTNGEFPLDTGANVQSDFTIPHQSWCSAVAHSSARGDTYDSIVDVERVLRAAQGVFIEPSAPYPEEAG